MVAPLLFRNPARKRIASAILLCLALLTAARASTDLSNIPISAVAGVKPNLMLVLDNSGSMSWDFLPDTANFVGKTSKDPVLPCYMNSGVNRIYYNPNVVYRPGRDASGNSLPEHSFNAAPLDGYKSSSDKIDHATRFVVAGNRSNPSGNKSAAYYTLVRADLDPSKCYTDSNLYLEVTVGPSERQNFANWFSYYRTRLLATKSSISQAFSTLDHQYRVGLWTINDGNGGANASGANFVPLGDFGVCPAGSTCTRQTWFQNVLSMGASGTTPLPGALRNVGEYYRTGRMPGSTATVHPIQYMCQRNYAIVATDGMWTVAAPDDVGNRDRTVPALPIGVASPFIDSAYGVTLTPGESFPAPFYEGETSSSNSLADVAMKYWISDLREDMANEVPAVPSNPATWQHMVTHAIGLGVNGRLPFGDATLDQIKSGAMSWPLPLAVSASTIDDLWHATVNGHGKYFSAANALDVQDALAQIIADMPQIKSSAPLALSGQKQTDANLVSYFSRYDLTQWSGELSAHLIDPVNGVPDMSNPLWAAHDLLDALPWRQRKIASYSGATGVAFAKLAEGGLSESQLARLNSPGSSDDHERVIHFLRGERTGEFNSRLGTGSYRKRNSVLGDSINAAPLFVSSPKANYTDEGYLAFKGRKRPDMIYLGSNDGMLHAFDAATGQESWAYVPGLLIDQPYVVANPPISHPDRSTLVNLAMRSGFTHLYYVDGTPVSSDVDLNNTAGANASTPAWATLLAAGLNKGGQGYYALDITDPAAANDAAVASKVLWEFPNDATRAAHGANVGYSFGKPIIVKTRKAGWVVLVTSGYNNGTDTGGDGRGRLFVLNARTGAVIKELVTDAGSADAPSGLAHISAYAEQDEYDRTTDLVYGGDLLGNVWRFSLAGEVEDWNTRLLAQLVDGTAAAVAQPITSAPSLSRLQGKVMVLLGTGRFLGAADAPGAQPASPHEGQVQSIYGLIDDGTDTPTITPLRDNLTPGGILAAGGAASGPSTGVAPSSVGAARRGWYFDLPRANERVLFNGVLARGVYTIATTLPLTSDGCTASAESFEYSINRASGAVLRELSLGNVFISTPTLMERSDGSGGVLLTSSGSGVPTVRNDKIPELPGSMIPRRLLWREIVDQE